MPSLIQDIGAGYGLVQANSGYIVALIRCVMPPGSPGGIAEQTVDRTTTKHPWPPS